MILYNLLKQGKTVREIINNLDFMSTSTKPQNPVTSEQGWIIYNN